MANDIPILKKDTSVQELSLQRAILDELRNMNSFLSGASRPVNHRPVSRDTPTGSVRQQRSKRSSNTPWSGESDRRRDAQGRYLALTEEDYRKRIKSLKEGDRYGDRYYGRGGRESKNALMTVAGKLDSLVGALTGGRGRGGGIFTGIGKGIGSFNSKIKEIKKARKENLDIQRLMSGQVTEKGLAKEYAQQKENEKLGLFGRLAEMGKRATSRGDKLKKGTPTDLEMKKTSEGRPFYWFWKKEEREKEGKKGILDDLFSGNLKLGDLLKQMGPALMTLGGIGAIVAGLIWAVIDGFKAMKMSEIWGTTKLASFIGGFLAGTESGWKGAFKNMGKWALIGVGTGLLVAGPVGALVGGLIGAAIGGILGFIGGEKIADLITGIQDPLLAQAKVEEQLLLKNKRLAELRERTDLTIEEQIEMINLEKETDRLQRRLARLQTRQERQVQRNILREERRELREIRRLARVQAREERRIERFQKREEMKKKWLQFQLMLMDLPGTLFPSLKKIFKKITEFFKSLPQKFVNFFLSLPQKIEDYVGNVHEMVNSIFKGLIDGVTKFFENPREVMEKAINKLREKIQNFFNYIGAFFTVMSTFEGGISVERARNEISRQRGGERVGIIEGINIATQRQAQLETWAQMGTHTDGRTADRFSDLSDEDKKILEAKAKLTFGYARGGIALHPQRATLAEHGEPEMILPLNRRSQGFDANTINSLLSGTGSASGRDYGREIVDALNILVDVTKKKEVSGNVINNIPNGEFDFNKYRFSEGTT